MSWMDAYHGLVRDFDPPARRSRLLIGHVSQASFFDVPLHDNLWRAGKAGPEYDLRTIFDNTVVSIRPEAAVTFVDNHE